MTVTFAIGTLRFEVAMCTDPSTGHESTEVYRTDISPRDLVATGDPDALNLKPAYASWGPNIAILEQAVMDSIEGEPA